MVTQVLVDIVDTVVQDRADIQESVDTVEYLVQVDIQASVDTVDRVDSVDTPASVDIVE